MTDAIQAITMPKWGLAMDEGMVAAWQVEEGAEVAAGDEILEIETTKITNVFESPAAGLLRRRVAANGGHVPPPEGLRRVFGDPVALRVNQAEVVLGIGVALVGRAPPPAGRLRHIGPGTHALGVDDSQVELRLGVATLGRGPPGVKRVCMVTGVIGRHSLLEYPFEPPRDAQTLPQGDLPRTGL